jgi:hypothetical protein
MKNTEAYGYQQINLLLVSLIFCLFVFSFNFIKSICLLFFIYTFIFIRFNCVIVKDVICF